MVWLLDRLDAHLANGTGSESRIRSASAVSVVEGKFTVCSQNIQKSQEIIGSILVENHALMLIRKLLNCAEFVAGDATLLRELLHPDKQPLALRYSLAHATVEVGQTSTPHALLTSEVYYILSGVGDMHIDDDVQPVEPGDAIYIPPGSRQYISNRGNEALTFLCIVDPAWRQEDEAVFQ